MATFNGDQPILKVKQQRAKSVDGWVTAHSFNSFNFNNFFVFEGRGTYHTSKEAPAHKFLKTFFRIDDF